VAAVVLILGMLLPAESYARRYAFAETLQFVTFAVAAPALLVLGAPWRFPTLTRDQNGSPGPVRRLTPSHWPTASRPAAVLLAFIAVVIAWRLPVTVNALPGNPALTLAEAVILLATGTGLWLELAKTPPLLPGLSGPLRAAMAAGAMWTIWVLAYIMGMSHGTWFTAYRHTGHGLSTAADQQFAVAIMWAVPALSFAPFIYRTLIAWISNSEDPDKELREDIRQGPFHPGLNRPPRPPRGWRGPR
jgi:cytochrome c oxidase assembly factor CtaG